MKIKKAFTMAEAILVMTILGIIATIMISTLKPAEFKEKGLAVLAKKVLSEIDTATTQILLNNSSNGTMETLYEAGTSNIFNAAVNSGQSAKLGNLYKVYLTAIRRATAGTSCSGYTNSFFLKDGACVGITTGAAAANVNTWFPGEIQLTAMKPTHGQLFFDTNGSDEPNVLGKDQFLLPLHAGGIQYAE